MNSVKSRASVVVLISGRGSNMRALIDQSRAAGAAYQVSKVLSDQPAAAGLKLARALDIPAEALDARGFADRASFEDALAAMIEPCSPALIVLAGFMRILSARFVEAFAGRILNIHPSLLPKYVGLHTHRRAIEAREVAHGATVHFVTQQLDGGPSIIQGRVAVMANDDEASLAARVQAQEHRIYPLAVSWFCEGRLRYSGGAAWLDGHPLREPVQFDAPSGTGA